MKPPLPNAILLSFLVMVAAGGACAGEPPTSDALADRAQYLEAEARRAAVRDTPDYGRHDRADVDRSRTAFCRRQANAPLGHWRVGSHVDVRDRRFHAVRNPHSHGLRRPPGGARWMCADSGDVLLVVMSSGLVSDFIPYE